MANVYHMHLFVIIVTMFFTSTNSFQTKTIVSPLTRIFHQSNAKSPIPTKNMRFGLRPRKAGFINSYCSCILTNLAASTTESDIALKETTENVVKVDNENQIPESIDRFLRSWNQSLYGDFASMRSVLDSNANWDNPFFSKSQEFYESMQQFSNFFLDPAISIFSITKVDSLTYKMDMQLSLTYPMPWRPRIIIPSRAVVSLSPGLERVTGVKETWELSVFDIFKEQFFPRFWDIWHVFSSPSPEYPPIKMIKKIGDVTIYEMPTTVTCEVQWAGLAKYPGPPISSIPGFSLFGELRTSKPKRERFITVSPVDVRSGKYTSADGTAMKRSVWRFHVPSYLQPNILANLSENSEWKQLDYLDFSSEIYDDEEPEEEKKRKKIESESEEPSITPDFVRDAAPSETNAKYKYGFKREPDLEYDEDLMKEFESFESKKYKYSVRPKRLVAAVDVRGEVTAEVLTKSVAAIRKQIESNRDNFMPGKSIRLAPSRDDSEDDSGEIGVQLFYTKACFNPRAEPSMAIYEMQYKFRKTRIYLDILVQ